MAAVDVLLVGVEQYLRELPDDELSQLLALVRPLPSGTGTDQYFTLRKEHAMTAPQGAPSPVPSSAGKQHASVTPHQAPALAAKGALDSATERIRADNRLTFEGKREAIEREREKARAAIEAAREAQRDDDARRTADLTRRFLDRQSDDRSDSSTLLHRDAAERVAQIAKSSDAQAMMHRAIQNGDGPLTKALLRAAIDNRWSGVANVYVAAHPARANEFRELWERTDPNGGGLAGQLTDALAFGTAF